MGLSSTTLNKELDKQIARIVVKNGDVIDEIIDEIDNSDSIAVPQTNDSETTITE